MAEEMILSAAEAAEFGEFKRARRETEIAFTLRKLVIDASRRETDRAALKKACETALRVNASALLVAPVHVSAAKKLLGKKNLPICCLVGGTGESLMGIKKTEAKCAVRQGAKEIRLVLCYSQLVGGGLAYLKREVKRVRRVVRKGTLVLSLEDHSLDEEEVALGVRAACAGRADAVCVRGETDLVLRATEESAGKVQVEVSGVENAEQLRLLLKAGAVRATTGKGEQIAEELYTACERPADTVLPPKTGKEGG